MTPERRAQALCLAQGWDADAASAIAASMRAAVEGAFFDHVFDSDEHHAHDCFICGRIRHYVEAEREACAALAAKMSGECVIYAPGNVEPCWGNIAGAIRGRA